MARLAELIGSLSLATDLAAGLALETALRTAILAVEIGRELGLRGEPLRDVYYTAVLRFIGCTAYAHEMARLGGGDDQGLLRTLTPTDATRPMDVLARAVRGGGLRVAARVMSDPTGAAKLATAHCELAVKLGARLGVGANVTAALAHIYARFDGKGTPARVSGEAIHAPARIMHVAFRAETQRTLEGADAVMGEIRRRAGGELDPAIAEAFLRRAADPRVSSAWDAFLAAEPEPHVALEADRVAGVAAAFADYADVKSPWTLGHSPAVARVAVAAAERARLPADERAALEIAALLHDLGRVSVPNGVWDKPGPLDPIEWERVRQHSYHTERILARSPLTAQFARVAGAHHERLDGSGYHRGVAPPGPAARLLGAADAFAAMTEERPHRRALSPDAAAAALVADARAGRLDRDAVEAVCAAAGSTVRPPAAAFPDGLSEREVEVLGWLARGLANKEIGARLFISPKTVQHHVAHIYEKTGISTRAAAAVYALQHQVVGK